MVTIFNINPKSKNYIGVSVLDNARLLEAVFMFKGIIYRKLVGDQYRHTYYGWRDCNNQPLSRAIGYHWLGGLSQLSGAATFSTRNGTFTL